MKKFVALAAIATLALVGCSSETKDSARETTSAVVTPSYESEAKDVTPTTTTPTTPPKSPRGNVVKQIGETGAVFPADGNPNGPYPFQYVVTAIEQGFQCNGSYPDPSENGQFVAIRMTLTTGPNLADFTGGGSLNLSSHDFQVIGTDGVQENNTATIAAYSCVADSEAFPIAGVGPGVTANVVIVVDTKAAAGILVFKPAYMQTGWEFNF